MTYGLPIVLPSIVVAVLGLALERNRIVVPLCLAIFVLFVALGWSRVHSELRPVHHKRPDHRAGHGGADRIRDRKRDARRLADADLHGLFPRVLRRISNARNAHQLLCRRVHLFGRALCNFIYRNSNDLAALTFFSLSMSVALALTEKKGWIKRAAFAGVGVLPLVILLAAR